MASLIHPHYHDSYFEQLVSNRDDLCPSSHVPAHFLLWSTTYIYDLLGQTMDPESVTTGKGK